MGNRSVLKHENIPAGICYYTNKEGGSTYERQFTNLHQFGHSIY